MSKKVNIGSVREALTTLHKKLSQKGGIIIPLKGAVINQFNSGREIQVFIKYSLKCNSVAGK